MSTKIEWTDKTWNPVVGCSIATAGCTNCYAMQLAHRLLDKPGSHYEGTTTKVNGNAVWTGKIAIAPQHIVEAPLKWKACKVFVNSMGDLFHENVPDVTIDLVFSIIMATPHITYQILTKRADRQANYMRKLANRVVTCWSEDMFDLSDFDASGKPPFLRNVWCGVSVENQDQADSRIPHLLATPAAVRFISAEPLLAAVDLRGLCTGWHFVDSLNGKMYHDDPQGPGAVAETNSLDWVICGGESGRGHRPMDPDWARSLRDQCAAAGVPFFFKQWGGKTPKAGGRLLDGIEHNEMPAEPRAATCRCECASGGSCEHDFGNEPGQAHGKNDQCRHCGMTGAHHMLWPGKAAAG